jgi:hypothetical protein
MQGLVREIHRYEDNSDLNSINPGLDGRTLNTQRQIVGCPAL